LTRSSFDQPEAASKFMALDRRPDVVAAKYKLDHVENFILMPAWPGVLIFGQYPLRFLDSCENGLLIRHEALPSISPKQLAPRIYVIIGEMRGATC